MLMRMAMLRSIASIMPVTTRIVRTIIIMFVIITVSVADRISVDRAMA